jgi:hypothetical protein
MKFEGLVATSAGVLTPASVDGFGGVIFSLFYTGLDFNDIRQRVLTRPKLDPATAERFGKK